MAARSKCSRTGVRGKRREQGANLAAGWPHHTTEALAALPSSSVPAATALPSPPPPTPSHILPIFQSLAIATHSFFFLPNLAPARRPRLSPSRTRASSPLRAASFLAIGQFAHACCCCGFACPHTSSHFQRHFKFRSPQWPDSISVAGSAFFLLFPPHLKQKENSLPLLFS